MSMSPERAQLGTDLAAADPATVTALGEQLAVALEVRHRAVPQAGLHLLTMEDAVFGEAFHLGELPVTSAWVEIARDDGEAVMGGAVLLGDDTRLATAIAICDAVLGGRLPGWEQVAALAAAGRAARDQLGAIRADARHRTLVDFAELAEDAP